MRWVLPLALLISWLLFVNNIQTTATAYDLVIRTALFDRTFDFHGVCVCVTNIPN